MNSLEFINREIESLQTEIEHLKNAIRLKSIYLDTFYECERGKECQARLNVLEQIKVELEAWQIVKNKTMGNDYLYEIVIYKSEKDDYEKFERALEVTNG